MGIGIGTCASSSSRSESVEKVEKLLGESRIKEDSLGPNLWNEVVEVFVDLRWGCDCDCCCCCCCCSRSFSTWAARFRSSIARGETMVTVFLALCACFSDNCLESKLARDGERRCAGEVFERASLRVGRICKEVVEVAATVCG